MLEQADIIHFVPLINKHVVMLSNKSLNYDWRNKCNDNLHAEV